MARHRRRVFDCAPHSRQRRGLGVGKALKRAGGRGRDCRHDAFGRLIIEDGDAAHFAAARLRADNEVLQPLDAGNDEGASPEHARGDATLRGLLFILEQCRQRRFGVAERLDLDLALRRGPPAAAAGGTGIRHEFFRQAEARAGLGIIDQPPPDGCRRPFRGRGKRVALGRCENAGRPVVQALLKHFDRGSRTLVEVAGGAFVVAEQGKIGLDGEPLGFRHRSIRARGRCRRSLLPVSFWRV
jgi:hypothetical protein